jgi:hypothetical protein
VEVVCVVNESEISLPSGRALTRKEAARLSELQSRAHLRANKYKRDDKRRQDTLIEVLTDEERVEMDALFQLRSDLEVVQIGDLVYKFAQKGEKGSVWLMSQGHAAIALRMHPERLRLLERGERPSVAPLRYSSVPSAFEQTFGYRTPEELAASPSFAREAISGPGLVVEDGVTMESIYSVTAPGERVGAGRAARAIEEATIDGL